jgi:hypothetical protein
MTLNAYLTAQGGLETQITSGITIDIATATAVLEKSLPAGSYEVRFELFSGTTKVDGGTEALRIIKDIQTAGTIALHVDTQLAAAPGYSLSTNLTTPVVGSIENIGASILPNTSVTATFNHISGGGSPDITVRWFLDGQQFATGPTASFSTFTGMHRLDAIASSTTTDSPFSWGGSWTESLMQTTIRSILQGYPMLHFFRMENSLLQATIVSSCARWNKISLWSYATSRRVEPCRIRLRPHIRSTV